MFRTHREANDKISAKDAYEVPIEDQVRQARVENLELLAHNLSTLSNNESLFLYTRVEKMHG